MTIRQLSIIAVVPILGVIISFSERLRLSLSVSESRIQKKLATLFPIQGKRYGISFSADTPIIRLKDDGLVHFGTLISIQYIGQSAQAYIEFVGKPEYQAKDKGFYLHDLKLFNFKWIPKQENGRGNGIPSVTQWLNLNDERLDQLKTEALQNVSESLLKRFREKLSQRPIYVLDQTKYSQKLVSLTLSDIKISEGTLDIEVSWIHTFQQVLSTCAFLLAIALLALGKASNSLPGSALPKPAEKS